MIPRHGSKKSAPPLERPPFDRPPARPRGTGNEAAREPAETGKPAAAPLSRLRVFLTDDHTVVREGLRLLINAQPDMRVVGEAGEGRTAVETLRQNYGENPPDVVLMDLSMPGWSGIETTARIREEWPAIKVLALTMHEDRAYLRGVLEAGASGYMLKRSTTDEVVRAIRTVAAGGTYLDPALTAIMVRGLLRKPGPPSPGGQ
jgi:DNA-binding NarL/FixJ family response regulator